ncbi:hypothetical protein K1719_022249 [Acacia pycnantha]|nr:hypothetical protein K1719_022249 [Acacia pycnantha]
MGKTEHRRRRIVVACYASRRTPTEIRVRFDGEPECSPQVFQIQGRVKQPVFTCKFSFRDRNVSSRSSMSEQSNSKRWLPSLASQKDHSAERKGWSITKARFIRFTGSGGVNDNSICSLAGVSPGQPVQSRRMADSPIRRQRHVEAMGPPGSWDLDSGSRFPLVNYAFMSTKNLNFLSTTDNLQIFNLK